MKIPDTWQKEAPIWLELQGVKQPLLVSVCIQAQPPSHSPFCPYWSTSHIDFSSCPFFFWGCDPLMIPERRPQKVERKGVSRIQGGMKWIETESPRPRTPATSACSPEHKGLHPCEFLLHLSWAPGQPCPWPLPGRPLLLALPILPLPGQLFSGSWIAVEH